MNTQPVIGANISQTLYQKNEKLVVPNDNFAIAYQNLSSLSGINEIPQDNSMHEQMPAYLSQAHLSTYYQDNPWDVLLFSKKFGLPTLGGNIDPSLPPGHRPGNILRNTGPSSDKKFVCNTCEKSKKEHFGNVDTEIKIHWQ